MLSVTAWRVLWGRCKICSQLAGVLVWSLVVSPSFAGSVLHKYVNSRGETVYSDRLPADVAGVRREELSDQGIIIKQVERAQTPAEIARDKRLRELLVLRQKFIDEQQARDSLLGKSFSTEADLIIARDTKVEALVGNITVAEENILRIQGALLAKQRTAADLERSGAPLPQALRKEIDSLRKESDNNRNTISIARQAQVTLRAKYDADLPRLRELLLQKALKRPDARESSSYHVWEVYPCLNPGACDAEWQQVTAYVRAQANTPYLMATDAVIVTADPLTDSEVAVIVTRLFPEVASRSSAAKPANTQFFLDVVCTDSAVGRALCDGVKGKTILDRFMPFLRGQL